MFIPKHTSPKIMFWMDDSSSIIPKGSSRKYTILSVNILISLFFWCYMVHSPIRIISIKIWIIRAVLKKCFHVIQIASTSDFCATFIAWLPWLAIYFEVLKPIAYLFSKGDAQVDDWECVWDEYREVKRNSEVKEKYSLGAKPEH